MIIKNIKIKSPEPSVIAVAELVIAVKHLNPKTPYPPRSVLATTRRGLAKRQITAPPNVQLRWRILLAQILLLFQRDTIAE